MKHPKRPKGWKGDLESLAQNIEHMRYDKLAEFLGHLAKALHERSNKDLKDKRPELACYLRLAGDYLDDSKVYIEDAWKICKPHMDKKEKKD